MEGHFDNMANAASNNNASMATLLAHIQALTAEFDNLQPAITPATATPAATTKKPKKARVYKQAKALQIFDPMGYCHTHGYRVTKTHNSNTCNYPGPNHDKDATRADIKNGSVLNKGWETNPNPM